ncbi:MAG TPA: AAA family ATPase [Phycisphaerae bacterium]|nr:AAA family ATPase [Phycisphaerae bacterium]
MIQDAQSHRPHRLKSISIVGGFLDGMNIEFADGLNCLIGHRGTGKTTVLEFIRYALDEFPRDDGGQARRRVETLVRSNLGDGRIRLALETRDGLEYTIDRSASGEPMVLTADGQPTDVRINSAGIFSADIFSQNEVENIADSPQSQLELIDRFAAGEIADVNRKIAGLRTTLDANTNAIVAHAQQLSGLANEVGELQFIETKIKALAEDENAQTDGEINSAQQHRALRGRETQAVKEAGDLIRKYSQWLHDSRGRFVQDIRTAFDEGMFDGPNGKVMSRIHETIKRIGAKLDRLFDQAAAEVDAGGKDLEDLAGRLQEAHQQQELAFRALIAKHNHARGVATERAELEKKRNEVLAKDRRKAELQRKFDQLHREREGVAVELRKLWDERFKIRQRIANWISEGANSSIRVRIDQCGDRSGYTQALSGWMKGYVGQYNPAAKKIADYIPPADLLRIVREGRADELLAQAELGENQASKAVEALGRLEVQLQLDAIELADLPRIELLEGQQWRNSLELSTGQKCTTILPILLLESHNPLLVDQPEDNLDNRYIYDTVVNAIHRVKQNRQIILITHNPNIPVLGEASAIYVLTSDGERSRLANRGSVDDCKIEIINLLEGGKEAFVRRKDRYNY